MDEQIVKTAYQEAENSLKEKQASQVKMIVLRTLEKIELLKSERDRVSEQLKSIDEDMKILRMDIDDLKEGRLDRIEERQMNDDRANEVSVAHLRKAADYQAGCNYWYLPYSVDSLFDNLVSTITGSSAKWATTGTYRLPGGRTLFLR